MTSVPVDCLLVSLHTSALCFLELTSCVKDEVAIRGSCP